MQNFENLNQQELQMINGGGNRHVTKIDIDGDGKWDMKTVSNTRTGKVKVKYRL